MDFKDYYATLGVAKTASDDEIKKAYRKLARKFHPDVNSGDKTAEARFKEINEANEVLSDPEKRRKYDELGANWRAYDDQARTSPPGGATYRTMTPEEMEAMFGGGVGMGADDPFSDFFHTFFGGAEPRATGRGGRVSRGRDLEHQVDLTLEEAFAGTTRRIVTTRGGKERSVDVRIPAGVKDGARVRAAGEGAPAARGGAAGDLYLIVRLLPHSRFERRGQDLHTHVAVPITTAVLGGEMSVPTLGAAPVRLKVPPLTDSGRVFRLRGHGMPTVGKRDERGDLYATVDLHIPSHVSDEARAHYEALRALEDKNRTRQD